MTIDAENTTPAAEASPRRAGPRLPDPLEVALVVGASVAWIWLLADLRHRPLELGVLAASVVALVVLGGAVDRRLGDAWAPAGVLAMLGCSFAGLTLATGVAPQTLLAFALGLLSPAGWRGDHLLLRALPLVMLAAHPWRRSWPFLVVSALGVTAFMGIVLMILDAAA